MSVTCSEKCPCPGRDLCGTEFRRVGRGFCLRGARADQLTDSSVCILLLAVIELIVCGPRAAICTIAERARLFGITGRLSLLRTEITRISSWLTQFPARYEEDSNYPVNTPRRCAGAQGVWVGAGTGGFSSFSLASTL